MSVVAFLEMLFPIPKFLNFPMSPTPSWLCDFDPGPAQPEKSSEVSCTVTDGRRFREKYSWKPVGVDVAVVLLLAVAPRGTDPGVFDFAEVADA